MACQFTQYPAVGPMPTGAKTPPGDAENVGGPYLVVSNHPETLGGQDSAIQLYKCSIPLPVGTQRFRFFAWHHSAGNSKDFRLKARLASGSGTVTEQKGYVDTSADLGQLGKCCPKALLYQDYPSNFADKTLGVTEVSLLSKLIPQDKTLGAMVEFDVNIEQAAVLELRTHTGSTPPGAPVVDDRIERHIRGWWPYSEASFAVAGNLDVNPLVLQPPDLWCPIEETHDAQGNRIVPPEQKTSAFGHQAADSYGWPLPFKPPGETSPLGGNVGLYGAIESYIFTLSNSDTVERGASLYLWARNNGGKVFGAAQIDSTGYPQWVVPTLQYVGGGAEGCNLTVDAGGSKQIMVPAGATSMPVRVKFTAGGASALPANLQLFCARAT